jgi:hypothetical protein
MKPIIVLYERPDDTGSIEIFTNLSSDLLRLGYNRLFLDTDAKSEKEIQQTLLNPLFQGAFFSSRIYPLIHNSFQCSPISDVLHSAQNLAQKIATDKHRGVVIYTRLENHKLEDLLKKEFKDGEIRFISISFSESVPKPSAQQRQDEFVNRVIGSWFPKCSESYEVVTREGCEISAVNLAKEHREMSLQLTKELLRNKFKQALDEEIERHVRANPQDQLIPKRAQNEKHYDYTGTLFEAAKAGSLKLVALLAYYAPCIGYNIHMQDQHKQSAQDYASNNGHMKCAELLSRSTDAEVEEAQKISCT